MVLVVAPAIVWPCHRWLRQQRIHQLEIECRQAREDADWNLLGELAAEWSEIDGQSGSPWLFLAESAEGTGDAALQAEVLDKVPDDDPRCVPALEARVDLLFQKLNQPLDAVATCRRILQMDPASYEIRKRLIYFYALTLQRRELIPLIRESIQVWSEPPESYAYLFTASQLRFSNGYPTNRRWLERHPDHEKFYVACVVYLQQENSAAEVLALEPGDAVAEPTLKECVRRFPRNIEVLILRLEESVESGDIETVEDLLDQAPEDAGQDSRFCRYRAWLHTVHGEHEMAHAELKKSLELDPYDWRSRHQLATVLRQLKMSEEAARMATMAQTGKLLSRQIVELPTAAAITPELLARLAKYADQCDDLLVANSIRLRLR